jgi:hypothetical protein
LDLRGRIVLGEESAVFRERICDLLAEGGQRKRYRPRFTISMTFTRVLRLSLFMGMFS